MLQESDFSQAIFQKFSKEFATENHRIGEMAYIFQGQKHTHKRHLNQLKKRHEMDANNTHTKWKNPSRLSTTHLTLKPLNTLPNNEDQRGIGKSQNPYLSIQNGRNTNGKNKPFWKQKLWEEVLGCLPYRGTRPHVTHTG